ncbi:hypothetical protein KEM54_005374 [Ascosphaera aggregata]|nr:hypothetical protein KEM54_005374 [Ascosphaera aggregata]
MKAQSFAVDSFLAGLVAANPVHHFHRDRTNHDVSAKDDGFWYSSMDHTGNARGYAPYAPDAANWPLYVAAKPNEAQSVIDAVNQGNRPMYWSANAPRVIYVPPGTYEFDKDLWMHVDTVIYGDAKNPPVFKPSANFPKGNRFFVKGRDKTFAKDAEKGQGELVFSVAMKNIVIDTSDFQSDVQLTALDWSVAQNTHLQNIHIKLAPHSGNDQNGQVGAQMLRGSSLALTDVVIEGGQYGIWHNGHQQTLYKNFTLRNMSVGMKIDGGFVITLLGCIFDTVGTAVRVDSGSPGINIIDCKSINSGVTFHSATSPSVTIESLDLDRKNANIVEMTQQRFILPPGTRVNTFTYGNTVGNAENGQIYGPSSASIGRPGVVAPGGHLPMVNAPDYKDKSMSDFVNVKDKNSNGGTEILGDNTKDEADNLQKVLNYAKDTGKIAYFPFGVYRVEKTLNIPVGLEIIGEAWSTISGQGNAFKDENKPTPVVKVGNNGDKGVVKISDMHFTVGERVPGAIIVEVNAAGNQPGDVGIWNSMITVGGFKGADDITNNCKDVNNVCKAAYNGLYLTTSSSVYVENTWVWVADHMTEGDGGSNIAGKAGVRVESTQGTWLYGLGSEHWWFYSLGLVNAKNVAVALLQAETNYDQGIRAPDNRQAPTPWTPNTKEGDPTFSTCASAACRVGYAAWITGGSDIFLYGEGGYKFGDGSDDRAAGDVNNQKYMNWIDQLPTNIQIYGVTTHGASNILRWAKGKIVSNKGFQGPWQAGLLGRFNH